MRVEEQAVSPMFPGRLYLLLCCATLTAGAQQVFVNEIHYDNTGEDAEEGIEITGPAGTLLSDYEVLFHNGNGGTANGGARRLFGVIPNQGNGAGAVWFAFTGIENGSPDGMVLYHWPSATVVQRISYEGSFTAVGGPADGQMLADIGVAESGATLSTQSLQLIGTGTELSNFTWAGPRPASRGALNDGQIFTATPVRSAAMLISPGLLKEGGAATLSLALTPAPDVPVTFTLAAMQPGILTLPAQITVNAAGTASVPVTALTDGVADGFQQTGVLAQPPDAEYPAAAAAVQVVDAERAFTSAPGALRVMSLNVKFGVGTPGSDEFNAVRELVERLNPDVLVMQEVAGANVFSDWFSLIQQCGYENDAAHVALGGDAWTGQPFSSGDLAGNLDQKLVTVSRHPIRQRVQIGRGSGRSEITRYPLLTVVDVPSLPDAQDPVVVNVHLKAGGEDADNFRRALEARRNSEALANFSGSSNVIIAGDFNATYWLPQPASYQTNVPAVTQPGIGKFADGSTLPQAFSAGADLLAGFTLPYATFPHSGFTPLGLSALNLEQLDGNERTFAFAAYKLDYFFVSPAIAARGPVATEIYNSRLEHLHDGLPKRVTLPAPTLSTTATDHFGIVADLPLVNQPALSVTFSRKWVNEGDAGLTATITATPAPAAPVTVTLNAWRDVRLLPLPAIITLMPGQPSVVVPIQVPWLPGLEPHRSVALTAAAAGCFSGTGSVEVRNREASGLLVISQYTEATVGSAPRAVELLNVSGADLDFAATPLEVRRYSNGDADGLVDALAERGVVPAGAVLVVGDDATGDYMVAQGFIPVPATPFAQQLEHTVSRNAAGKAAFLLDQLVFTGNDALEVLVNGTRSDVLGEIGHDPGTAWTGPAAESTVDGTLTLRPNLATGSSGWRQPGLRFNYAAGAGLENFGIAPAVSDPYLTWASSFGLTGLKAAPASDPDGDGTSNLAEYGLMTSPLSAASAALLNVLPAGFTRRLRTNDPTLTFVVESSPNLSTWTSASGAEVNGATFQDSEERTFTSIGPQPPLVFLRQRVSRP